MAELPLKRQRDEETLEEEADETKRHKPSYNDILSLLDEAYEEQEPAQDLSSLMTSLQHELSSESSTFDFILCPNTENDQETSKPITSTSSSSSSKKDEVDDKERVMRLLLEASDDELGIPSMEAGDNNSTDNYDKVGINSDVVDGWDLCDGLWDLEDEAANYYTLLQSQLFM